MQRKYGMVILAIVVGLLSIGVVSAQPIGAEDAIVVNSTRYNTSLISPSQVNAQAGNVTELTINASGVTTSWQGYYGNVTGSLILADSQGNNFYDWNVSSPSGEIYASRSSSVTWASINCSNTTAVTTEETYLGQSASDPDSVSNTYSLTSHPAFLVGSRNMTNCSSTHAYDSTGDQGTDFWQVLLNDGPNTVYSTIMSAGTGFNSLDWDFELLVGENGKAGNEGATPYYFYVELQ